MLLDELLNELETFPWASYNGEVLVEINGVQHSVHEVQDCSQGVVLFVDTDQEERDMR